jgi:hypothetical protein
MAKSNRFTRVLSVLQKEENVLESQIGKVRDAIAALGGVGRDYKVRRGIRKAKTVARNVRKMSAEQRKAVSLRMKRYWAGRKKT